MIEGKLYDKDFKLVDIVDSYESFIWTDRYNEAGDFEITTSASPENVRKYAKGYYLEIEDSEHTMIIETVESMSDMDAGIKLKIAGRSIESILDRRIFWKDLELSSSAQIQNNVKTCLYNTLMPNAKGDAPPGGKNRIIDVFSFSDNDDPELANITMLSEQINMGDNLYEVIVSICQSEHVGWKVIRDGKNFVMSLYLGTNRSYNQKVAEGQAPVPYVVFSPGYDNIINSDFVNSSLPFKNMAKVTSSYNNSEITVTIGDDITGLDRREVSFSLDRLKPNSGETETHYKEKMRARAKKELAKSDYREAMTFTGKIEASRLFVYNEDFYIGDIVEVINELGNEASARITEFVMSDSDGGFDCYPTFIDTADEN